MNDFKKKLDSYFMITEKGSSVKTEITAGVATFMTMCYILLVNSDILSNAPDVGFNAIFIATAISAIIGTLMMAFYAKMPFAQAPGMGLNAFFMFSVIFGMGLSYGNALVVVLVSGILFLCLTLVGVREKIVVAIPDSLRLGIPAGIGLFIAFIGMQNAGIIINNDVVLVELVDFSQIFTRNVPADKIAAVHGAMSALVALVTFFIIAILNKKKIKGSILYGILIGTVVYYILQVIIFRQIGSYVPGLEQILPFELANPFKAFGEFGREAFFAFSFAGLMGEGGLKGLITLVTLIISFAIVDMFDTIGTLIGTAKKAGMLRKDGTMENMNKALLCDSVATIAGAALGTSTVTTYVESSAGIAEGGRTGMTALTVAVLFLIAMLFTPIAAMIPSAATAAALIYIGVIMIGSLADLDFEDPAVVAPAFMTAIGMPLTYSIADGIGLGIITYLVIKLFTGKIKDIHPFVYLIAGLFILKFFVL